MMKFFHNHLKGWHRGELAIQQKLNYDWAVAGFYEYITNFMPEDHRDFHTTRIPFVPVTTLDVAGRPWGSILAGPRGLPGFIRSPNSKTLTVGARVWDGDPIIDNVKLFEQGDMLFAGIGIDLSTRTRNKFAGRVSQADLIGIDLQLDLFVTQTIGYVFFALQSLSF